MRPFIHPRPCRIWIVALLLLVQALLPALLHAAAPVRLHEVCTSLGVKRIAVQEEGSAAQQHCQLCVLAQQDVHTGPQSFIFHPQPIRFVQLHAPVEAVASAGPLVLRLRGPPPADHFV